MNPRRYLLTGSASGIGSATAQALRQRGGDVIGVDLHDAEIVADLSTPHGRTTVIDQARGAGRIDAVLAIAGGGRQRVLQTNYFGTVAVVAGLRDTLARSPSPRAVVVSSTAALAPADPRALAACAAGEEDTAAALVGSDPALAEQAYGTAKRALNAWIRRSAPTPQWAGAGIALNAVAPGVVDTPAAQWLLTDDQIREQVRAAAPQPLGGFPGRPEWIAELLVWLSSAENAFVTGQIIFADGGCEAQLLGDRAWRG